MPNMDGFELCKYIQKTDQIYQVRNCPVLAITACVSNEIDIKAKEVGMKDVLHKPANKE